MLSIFFTLLIMHRYSDPFHSALEAQEGKKSFNMFSWLTLKELINPQWDAVRSKTGLFVAEQEQL